MLKLTIENCRNIVSVVEDGNDGLLLDEGKLNVLYGRNGVGKTTIARALRHAGGRADDAVYESLKSYEHLKNGDEGLLPVAGFSDGRQRECLVFDRAWVEDHYFKSDDSIADGAYRLCVDEGKLKNLRRNRDKLCAELKAAAAADPLPEAISEAEQMAKALGAGKSGFTGASKMASALKNGGALAGLPAALDAVVPDEPELKGKWAAWHLVGGQFAPTSPPTCPYCGEQGERAADAVAFDQQHDPGQADAWLSAMKALEGETGHFDPDSVGLIRAALTTGTSDAHLAEQVSEFGGFLSSVAASYRAIAGIADTPMEGPSAPTARVIENHVKALRAGACAFDPGVARRCWSSPTKRSSSARLLRP